MDDRDRRDRSQLERSSRCRNLRWWLAGGATGVSGGAIVPRASKTRSRIRYITGSTIRVSSAAEQGSSDDDDGDGTLGFGTDGAGQRRRNQTQCRQRCRHQHGA